MHRVMSNYAYTHIHTFKSNKPIIMLQILSALCTHDYVYQGFMELNTFVYNKNHHIVIAARTTAVTTEHFTFLPFKFLLSIIQHTEEIAKALTLFPVP